jgi:hypothetical protein
MGLEKGGRGGRLGITARGGGGVDGVEEDISMDGCRIFLPEGKGCLL